MYYPKKVPSHNALDNQSGFTIIEVLIVMFIIGTVVTGLFGLFVLSMRSAQEGERRVAAVALANERMEMIRNLPYAQVGTFGGVPPGTIAQSETVERNDVDYTVETDIRYVDDTYDGSVGGFVQGDERVTICHKPGTAAEQTLEVPAASLNAHLAHGDTTGECASGGESTGPGDEFNADYKQVRVEVSWPSQYVIAPILLITYVAPKGIEGSESGGVLDFQALDAGGVGVPGASVHIVNSSVNPAIDLTTQTNSEGRVVLPAMPVASGSYELSVTKDGFSSERTYDAEADFTPDPDHSHLSILQGQVTSKTFFIDLEAELTVEVRQEDAQPVAAMPFRLRGLKTIGLNGDGETVFAFDTTGPTDALGNYVTDLPWDTYTYEIDGVATGFDIKETSLLLPLKVNPGDELTMTVTVVPHTDVSLHVTVVNDAGEPVDNATVRVEGSGYDQTQGTGALGQLYFGDLPLGGDYTVTIDAPGFEQLAQTVLVTGTTRVLIGITPEE